MQDAEAADDSDADDPDREGHAEAATKLRIREAEDWRLRQLQSGQAASNANFQVRQLFEILWPGLLELHSAWEQLSLSRDDRS